MLAKQIFDLLATTNSIAEFQLKSVMQIGFLVGNKPLPRGTAQQLIVLIESRIGRVHSYIHSKMNKKDAITNQVIKNIVEICKTTPLFQNLKYTDIKYEIKTFYKWHCLMTDGNYNYPNVSEDTEKFVEILEKC